MDTKQEIQALGQEKISKLLLKFSIPCVMGLCAAIITQVSDVEDEINGFLTYDRQVNKANPEQMQKIAEILRKAMEQEN